MTEIKLTKKLIEILIFMNSGWELGISHAGSFGFWLQKGGCGKGGEYKEIHGRTNIYKLKIEGLIASNGYGFPTEKYHLTDKGKLFLERRNKCL